MIAGGEGVFIAVFWYLGRAYAEGLFDAMNIPSFHIELSVWEYAELSTQWVLLFTIFFLLD